MSYIRRVLLFPNVFLLGVDHLCEPYNQSLKISLYRKFRQKSYEFICIQFTWPAYAVSFLSRRPVRWRGSRSVHIHTQWSWMCRRLSSELPLLSLSQELPWQRTSVIVSQKALRRPCMAATVTSVRCRVLSCWKPTTPKGYAGKIANIRIFHTLQWRHNVRNGV